ncbi:MAG: hypothetical protein RLZZ535_1292 [Cyanobacteriota bacterium]|jgi:hypothetical protein
MYLFALRLFLLVSINLYSQKVLATPEYKNQTLVAIDQLDEKSDSWIEDEKISKKVKEIKFVEHYDRFLGYEAVLSKDFKKLGGIGGLLNINEVRLNIVRYEGDDNSRFYYARIVYNGDGWAHLENKAYLIINETERIVLEGYGQTDSSVDYCSSFCVNTEGIRVVIPDEVMLKMSQANSIEISVRGNNKSFDAYFKDDHHAQVRKFIDLYDDVGRR